MFLARLIPRMCHNINRSVFAAVFISDDLLHVWTFSIHKHSLVYSTLEWFYMHHTEVAITQ